MTNVELFCIDHDIPADDHVSFRRLVQWGQIPDDFGRRLLTTEIYMECFVNLSQESESLCDRMWGALEQFMENYHGDTSAAVSVFTYHYGPPTTAEAKLFRA